MSTEGTRDTHAPSEARFLSLPGSPKRTFAPELFSSSSCYMGLIPNNLGDQIHKSL